MRSKENLYKIVEKSKVINMIIAYISFICSIFPQLLFFTVVQFFCVSASTISVPSNHCK